MLGIAAYDRAQVELDLLKPQHYMNARESKCRGLRLWSRHVQKPAQRIKVDDAE